MNTLSPSIETIIIPRAAVGTQADGRSVILFDEFGPVEFLTGQDMDVRPHPHIGLATVTYLFEGEVFHRDSLTNEVPIRAGDVNWMTAGRGIVHAERASESIRSGISRLAGIRSWVALPADREEIAPFFAHVAKADSPVVEALGARVRVIAGAAYGVTAPTPTLSDTLYADIALAEGTTIPIDPDYEDRAVYTLSGEIEIAGDRFGPGQLLVFRAGDALMIRAQSDARFLLLGGARLDGPRHIWWNFVSSRKDRIESANADWKAGRFALVPNKSEFIPLPE
jgi:redox-sensitive bicupin YhaK (pirin superfamily)